MKKSEGRIVLKKSGKAIQVGVHDSSSFRPMVGEWIDKSVLDSKILESEKVSGPFCVESIWHFFDPKSQTMLITVSLQDPQQT